MTDMTRGKSMKFLFINTNCSWNKGSAAQVFSTMSAFKQEFPDCEFILISQSYEVDLQAIQNSPNDDCELEVVGYPTNHRLGPLISYVRHTAASLARLILWKCLSLLGFPANSLLREKYLSAYQTADVVIDLSGDSLADGKVPWSLINCLGILHAILLKKPFVIYSQSIGPFNWISRSIVRYCLRRAKVIILREEISERIIRLLKVDEVPICLKADCAFALEPATPEQVNKIMKSEGIDWVCEKPVMGISVSTMLESKDKNYTQLVVKLIDYIIEKFDARVLLIPHVIAPEWVMVDDRVTAKNIFSSVKNKSRVRLILGDYSPSELKGIIGICDLFIGSRMHANIAALSMGVPTIAIGWSHKYSGIMSLFGLEKYAFDYKSVDFETLRRAIDQMWDSKEDLRKSITLKSSEARASALEAASIVKTYLETFCE